MCTKIIVQLENESGDKSSAVKFTTDSLLQTVAEAICEIDQGCENCEFVNVREPCLNHCLSKYRAAAQNVLYFITEDIKWTK